MEIDTIIHSDCLEVLQGLDSDSIDSVVTDPPYGICFMGKHWDYQVPTVKLWKEILRVLKPGGHALVACGTRTQHRMAVNLEDAGFEIRDIIAWVYGSGFPKSLNIGKAVDKIQGNEREVVGKYQCPDGRERNHLGGAMLPLQKGTGEIPIIDKGSSPFEGWGTGLKPAMELWTLCRKPLIGTVAENVLKWGTGGINIDGCRVGNEEITVNRHSGYNSNSLVESTKGKWKGEQEQVSGRFPANFIHDGSDEVVSLFPECHPAGNKNKSNIQASPSFGIGGLGNRNPKIEGDNGGSASRFFYCAKSSTTERNRGLVGKKNTHATVKPITLMRYLVRLITPKGGLVLDPFIGSGTTAIACKLEGFHYLGIEKEQEYVEIAKARVAYGN